MTNITIHLLSVSITRRKICLIRIQILTGDIVSECHPSIPDLLGILSLGLKREVDDVLICQKLSYKWMSRRIPAKSKFDTPAQQTTPSDGSAMPDHPGQ
jgi:hypothetical protein